MGGVADEAGEIGGVVMGDLDVLGIGRRIVDGIGGREVRCS